jgi:hypothetical protein
LAELRRCLWKRNSADPLARWAAELAEEFFVVADFGGHGFECLAELVELYGESGEGEGLLALVAVLGDDGVQFGTAIQGGSANSRASGYGVEGDLLASGGQLYTSLFYAG